MNAYLTKITHTIKTKEGCGSVHRGTVKVREEFKGRIAWEGEVEIFELLNHPKARRCYAWGYKGESMSSSGLELDHIFIVLEIDPVDSAQRAVRAAIAAVAKRVLGKK
jgi:hypothetical protein